MLAKPHVSFPWFFLFCLLWSLFILSLFSSSPQQLPVSKILPSWVWQGPWILSFVLNPSRVLHPQEAEQKFLLASWPWHEFCTLVDICFCGEGLPLNLLQCRSSRVLQPGLVKPTMFPAFRKSIPLSVKSWLSFKTSDSDICCNFFHLPLYLL